MKTWHVLFKQIIVTLFSKIYLVIGKGIKISRNATNTNVIIIALRGMRPWYLLAKEDIGSINNDFRILSKVSSVTYKLGSEQAIEYHPKNKRHVVLCYLMCSIRHLKAKCAIYVGVLSHQLRLTMNRCNAEIIGRRDNNEFSPIELNQITFHKQIMQVIKVISTFVLENFISNSV